MDHTNPKQVASSMHGSDTDDEDENKNLSLSVMGAKKPIITNTKVWEALNHGTTLIPVAWDSSILADRFDVRALLSSKKDLVPSTTKTALQLDTLEFEALAEAERYRDLLDPAEQKKQTFNAVGFKYTEVIENTVLPQDNNQQPKEEVDNREGYRPSYPIPYDIQLPPNEKVHKIIERTALFIRDAGQEQLEKLRASQTDNPAFSFLSLSGPLHPYFLFLTKSERNRSQQVILSKLGKSKQRIQPTLPTRSENQQNTTISKPALSLNVELSTSSPQQSSSKVSGKKALIPPHRLKLIIDKFISFVGKHGIQFAYKVRDKEKQNPDFDFLLPWDKYHDYYTEQLAILTAKKRTTLQKRKKK